jgi:hypothetical protein
MTVDAHKYAIAKRVLGAIPADVLHPYQLNADDYIRLVETRFRVSKAKMRLVKTGLLFDHCLIMAQKRCLPS